MALTGVKGPDRVLYALTGLLENKLPAALSAAQTSCSQTLLIPPKTPGILHFSVDTFEHTIEVLQPVDIINIINSASTPLTAHPFSENAIILTSSKTVKFLDDFSNLKKNQISVSSAVPAIQTYIISGVVPGENQLKLFPAIVVNLQNINPAADGILCTYGVQITAAVTTPINTSQIDLLSKQLLTVYDCIKEILDEDDGSLGGVTNGVTINSANIQDVAGNQNYLKLLNISLSIIVEED